MDVSEARALEMLLCRGRAEGASLTWRACRAILQCEAPQPTLVKYRVGPSSCGALRTLQCPSLFSCSPNQCCPSMADLFNQALDCCPTLAEGASSFQQIYVTRVASLRALTDARRGQQR